MPIMIEGSLSEYKRDELAKLGKKWVPVPAVSGLLPFETV